MAKRKKKETASGRESILKPELPEVPEGERTARFSLMQTVAQDLHDVERRLEKRNIEKLELKGKLDKVSDDCKSLDARANALRREIVEVLEGRATGRLPFGPGVSAEKPVTPEDLKTTPAKLAEAYYPELLNQLMRGEVPSVTKAITIEGTENRHVLVDDDSGHHRLLSLHTPGWQAPSSAAELPEITGKVVDFMEAKLVIGTADECPLVLVELPGTKKHGAGGRTDPGGTTRGASIDRAKGAVGAAVNELLTNIRTAGLLTAPRNEKQADLEGLALIAEVGKHDNPRRWLNLATLDDLTTLESELTGLVGQSDRWSDLADGVGGRMLAGIPDATTDDFGPDEGDAGAPEGDEAVQDDAGGPSDDGDDSSDVGAPRKGRSGPRTPKRGGGKKSGAAKAIRKHAKKAK